MKVLLITNEERQLPEEVFTDGELNTSVRRNLITTPFDANDNIIKKLACIMKVVLSLNKLDNTTSLENQKLSNFLLRYDVTISQDFTSSEPFKLHYKILKNREFTSLTLRIMD